MRKKTTLTLTLTARPREPRGPGFWPCFLPWRREFTSPLEHCRWRGRHRLLSGTRCPPPRPPRPSTLLGSPSLLGHTCTFFSQEAAWACSCFVLPVVIADFSIVVPCGHGREEFLKGCRAGSSAGMVGGGRGEQACRIAQSLSDASSAAQ